MSLTVKYLRYTLTLQVPAIVTTLSGDPNSAATQPFIPGNVIRGALAGRLLASGIKAESDDFRTLILVGCVRFLHAFPAKGSTRTLPAPVSWRHEKGKERNSAFDLASYTGQIDAETEFGRDNNGELTIDPEDSWPTASLQRASIPAFVAYDGSGKIGVKVLTDARMHQQRDRTKGRSWTERDTEKRHGEIFAFEFLEPNQAFQGIIQVIADSDGDADAIIDKIKATFQSQTILVGRSRRAGYGGAAKIEFGQQEKHEANWGDIQGGDVPADSLFRVYLLSACIVRDPHTGQVDPCALPNVLVRRLGGKETVCVERTFWDFEVIGGFNRKWQIEVPQALAVKAGSVLVLKARQAIPGAKLHEIRNEGIGERCIEGFGRLAFLLHSESLTVAVQKKDDKPSQNGSLSKPEPELVRFLQQRVLDAAVSRALDRKVRDIIGNPSKIPSGSLLGRLRIPLRAGKPEDGLNTMQKWLRDPDPKEPTVLKDEAQKKLRECKLASGSLRDWLIKTATATSGANVATSELIGKHRISDGAFAKAAAEERGAYYAVRLIDTVLAALAHEVRKEGKQ